MAFCGPERVCCCRRRASSCRRSSRRLASSHRSRARRSPSSPTSADAPIAQSTEKDLAQRLMVQSLLSLTETRDAETGRHSRRTRQYTRLLAEQLAANPTYREYLTPFCIDLLATLAPLHDIGKVGVPDQLLNKPGELTPEEFREMQKHPVYGLDVITRAERDAGAHDDAILEMAKDIVYTHHERWDGKGYPRGLRGEQIPVAGRLIALVDVYDAMTTRTVLPAAAVARSGRRADHRRARARTSIRPSSKRSSGSLRSCAAVPTTAEVAQASSQAARRPDTMQVHQDRQGRAGPPVLSASMCSSLSAGPNSEQTQSRGAQTMKTLRCGTATRAGALALGIVAAALSGSSVGASGQAAPCRPARCRCTGSERRALSAQRSGAGRVREGRDHDRDRRVQSSGEPARSRRAGGGPRARHRHHLHARGDGHARDRRSGRERQDHRPRRTARRLHHRRQLAAGCQRATSSSFPKACRISSRT